ncbi:hypothetical protein CKO11_13935 [Rhodobacter sp. TJ_12]|nr:hypothetical protein [Rhodobacter sp. TJ_12]
MSGFGTPRTIIVEPDPARVAWLETQTRGMAQITLLAGMIAAQDGEAELNIFNVPGLNSLHAPAPALEELYPGLRICQRPVISLITPAKLIAAAAPLQSPVTLRLDTPGDTTDILLALTSTGDLTGFDKIELRCCADDLFGTKTGAEAAKAILIEAGFTVQSTDNSDPDWPVLHFILDRAAMQIRKLESALSEARTEITALQASAKTRDERTESLEAELKAVKEKAEWRLKRIKELESEAEAARAGRDTLKAKTEASDARITSLEADLKAITEKAEWRLKRIKELEANTQQLEKERDRERSDLGLALRMQTLAGSDLSDLRQRYAALQDQKLRQDTLISQLVVRLEEASGYLQDLASLPSPTAEPISDSRPVRKKKASESKQGRAAKRKKK